MSSENCVRIVMAENLRFPAHLLCQQNGIAEIHVKLLCSFRIGMQSVAVYSQRTNRYVILFQRCDKRIVFLFVSQQLRGIAMCPPSRISVSTRSAGTVPKSKSMSEGEMPRMAHLIAALILLQS